MSVRAYKLIEIKTAKSPTFNCWSNNDIFALANADGYNDGGVIIFDKATAEIELSEIEVTNYNDNDEENNRKEKIKILKQIIKDCGDEDYCEYYCY